MTLDLTKFDVYIVGGYCRDRLLNRECNDHDYVVVGATHQDMVDAGFKQVGSDFPVYLHALTGDEYALARQERKVSPGYNGFETTHDTSVTLEDDLVRRDLTVNAMAREVVGWNEEGHAKLSDDIIDPFGGLLDLQNKILRHVSEAFAEDPVRVLRVARFRARYSFSIAPETRTLMKQLVDAGELDHLTPERIWNELDKAIMEDYPNLFFWALMDCGAIDKLFPGFGRSIIHIGSQLKRAALRSQPKLLRYTILFSNMDHEPRKDLLIQLIAPIEVRRVTAKFGYTIQALYNQMLASDVIDILDTLNAYQQTDDLTQIGKALCFFDSKRNGKFDTLMEAFRLARKVSFASLTQEQQDNLNGSDIKKAINKQRVVSIRHLFHKY